jgi:hypothetical protein
MLIRARLLRRAIEVWLKTNEKYQYLTLREDEWKMVEYLIDLTKPFAQCTKLIGKSRGPSIQEVYTLYEFLFSHIDKVTSILTHKKGPWKRSILEALQESRKKLSKYYNTTYGPSGSLYGIATVLAPYHKLSLFESENWTNGQNGEEDWGSFYLDQLEQRYADYYYNTPPSNLPSQGNLSIARLDDMAIFVHGRKKAKILVRDDESEIGRYLSERMCFC